jgi:hypothetical protein
MMLRITSVGMTNHSLAVFAERSMFSLGVTAQLKGNARQSQMSRWGFFSSPTVYGLAPYIPTVETAPPMTCLFTAQRRLQNT